MGPLRDFYSVPVRPRRLIRNMKHGLIVGLDGAGKTLLVRQLTLHLSKNRRGVVGKLFALAQSASCISADVLAPRNRTSSTAEVLETTPTNVIHQALHYASMYHHQPLAAHFKHGGSSNAPMDEALVDRETQPTVGVEHTPMTIDGKASSLCEIGGQLLPMWKAYYDECDFWVYVVDISSPSHVAAAAIEFLNVMSVDAMRRKPKLLLLNKMDSSCIVDDALLRAYLCLDRLMTDSLSPMTSSGPMHVVKISALSGENIASVLKWISQRHASGNPPSNHGATHAGPSLSQVSIGRNGRVHPMVKGEKQREPPLAQNS